MSIANIIVAEGGASADVYTDTDTRDAEGLESGERAKCLILPTLQAAVTGRGDLPVLFAAWGFLWNCNLDFDQSVDALSAIGMAEGARAVRAQHPEISLHNHIAVVGWSPEAGRYRLHLLRQDGDEEWSSEEVEGSLLMPWTGPPPRLHVPGDAVTVAKQQVKILRADNPKNAGGGRLHRTQLLPGGREIRIDTIYTWPAEQAATPFPAMAIELECSL